MFPHRPSTPTRSHRAVPAPLGSGMDLSPAQLRDCAQDFSCGAPIPEVTAYKLPLLVHVQDGTKGGVCRAGGLSIAKCARDRALIDGAMGIDCLIRPRPPHFGCVACCTGLVFIKGKIIIEEDCFPQLLFICERGLCSRNGNPH